MKNIKHASKIELEQIENAWLNIDIRDEYIQNPAKDIPEAAIEEPYIFFSYLMSRPEYFAGFCKYVMNIDLLPFQSVIQQNLWNFKFPLLVASRGASKSWSLALYCLLRMTFIPNRKIIICGAGFRQSKIIFEYMDAFYQNAPLLRDMLKDKKVGGFKDTDMWKFLLNGGYSACLPVGTGDKIRGQRANDLICLSKDTLIQTDKGLIEIQDYLDGNSYSLMNRNGVFENPKYTLVTDPTDVYEIKTRYGYSFKCSAVHQVLTEDGWKKAKDLVPDVDRLEIDCNDYFPNKYVTKNQAVLNEDIGWLMGILISEGSLTNRNIFSFNNTDKKLIDYTKDRIDFLDWSEDYKAAYIDKRGWNCKESWTLRCSNTAFRNTLRDFDLGYGTAIEKTFPKTILRSPRSVVVAFLSGMYEGDGTAFFSKAKSKDEIHVALYSSSYNLIKTTQSILLKFGILSAISGRDSNLSSNVGYMLQSRGRHGKALFDLLDVLKWEKLEPDDYDFERVPHIRPSKNGKKWSLSTNRGNKNVYLGTFHTKEECFGVFDEYWKDRREVVLVKSVTKLPETEVLYDFHMPETHSFIGNGFVQHNCDEFSSINPQIFETVMAGFAAVSSDPVGNTKRAAARREAEKIGIELEYDSSKDIIKSNQIVISGTAYYSFNHFCTYWKRWKAIIGYSWDPKSLEEYYPEGIPGDLNPEDYSVIRIPVDLIPEDFMDMGQVARTKGSINKGVFQNEYGACFSADSDGFFRRTLIESCIAHVGKIFKDGEDCYFEPRIYGDPNFTYVMGVDPASEHDNFSIVLLELHKDHRRLVYSWTTTRKNHQARLKSRLVEEHDFYSYVNRKVRSLMERFNIERIIIDSQGGGYAVIEAFKNEGNMKQYEKPILEIRDPKKPKDSDRREGHHIVELATFADAKWFSAANHGMKKDMEDQVLIFPSFDALDLGLAIEQDKLEDRVVDTIQDCVEEVELLKDELCTIVMQQTTAGREQFVTPEEVTNGSKRRQKKDRYSSLVIANMAARILQNDDTVPIQSHIGGFAGKTKAGSGPMFYGNEYVNAQLTEAYKDYD
jgi:hypothetical protein